MLQSQNKNIFSKTKQIYAQTNYRFITNNHGLCTDNMHIQLLRRAEGELLNIQSFYRDHTNWWKPVLDTEMLQTLHRMMCTGKEPHNNKKNRGYTVLIPSGFQSYCWITAKKTKMLCTWKDNIYSFCLNPDFLLSKQFAGKVIVSHI